MNEHPIKKFSPWLQELGVELNEARLALFEVYLDELCRWNARMNLVGPASRDRIIRELVLDSLVAFPILPVRGNLLDVGSGAGFPALPLKICGSKMEFLLVEPIQKRVNFLKHVMRNTGIKGLSVVRGRVESVFNFLNPAGYDVVTTRAMAPFDRTVRLCGRHVAAGGMLLTFHGETTEKTFNESALGLEAEGLALERLVPYRLPGVATARHLAVLRKKT